MKVEAIFGVLIILCNQYVQAFAPSSFMKSSFRSIDERKLTIGYDGSHTSPSGVSPISLLAARRQLLSEDDLAAPPNQKVIEAVEQLGGNDVVASDVAAKAGLSLSTTQQSLSSLASLTRGDISVTSSGDLLYSFPGSIQGTLSGNSLRYRLTKVWSQDVWPKLFWGIRVAFGVFLFISIALIFSTLVFIQSGDDRDDRDNRGGGIGFPRYGFGNFLFDLFYYSPRSYYGYYGRVDAYDPRTIQEAQAEEERSGILEGIFSYIFGDGDPNRQVEQVRLREASRVIRASGGAVTAEQLAPFCDVGDPNELGERFLVEEGFVLPVVSQLGGQPEVTSDGDIVYIFPELQISARDDRYERSGAGFDMAYLEEKTLEFSRNPAWGNVVAAGLGAVNLGGALYLGRALTSPALASVQLSGVFGLVQAGYPLLLVYAILFNVIPLARYFYIEKKNTEIKQRNSARRKWLTYLEVGGGKIRRKLEAAKAYKKKMRRLSNEGVVYDTKKSFDSLAADKEKDAMARFDEKLDNNDTSFQ